MAVEDHDAERSRVAALQRLGLLGGPADAELEAVVRVAAAVAGTPFATLNLVDASHQCQLASTGFEGATSAAGDSMCDLHFREGRTVHVADASLEAAYRGNPWVDGRLGAVRLYASVPLVTADGHALGSLCVFDTRPGHLDDAQLARLEDLAVVLLRLFERRAQLREVEEARELTEAVLDTIDVAVVAAGPDGRLTLFNRAARQWHDLPADPTAEPAEHAARYALYEADGATPMVADRVPLHRALREGAVVREEMVVASLSQPPRTVVASGRAMARADGTPLGAVVVMSDVTEARERTRALEELHDELERSNDELARFAAVASHDLRSPLAVVDGYLELLEDELGEAPAPVQGWVAAGRRSVRRMLSLTSSLLDYASAGAPGRPRAQPVDVSGLAREAVSDLRTAVAEAGAVVEVGALPTVLCEPVAVRQVLQNLVANALQHRRPGAGCRVVVSARPVAPSDPVGAGVGRWVFSVADDGPGVAPEDRERAFEVFTTLPRPRRAPGGADEPREPERRSGHGIGLATCQRVVARHGGRIWLEETPGGGATVSFTLS